MMACGLRKDPRAMLDTAPLWIRRAVPKTGDPGMCDGTGTHGTRLERDPKPAANQPFASRRRRGRPDDQDFGMRSWILIFTHTIAGRCENRSIWPGQDCPHRGLSARCGQARLLQRQRHDIVEHVPAIGRKGLADQPSGA